MHCFQFPLGNSRSFYSYPTIRARSVLSSTATARALIRWRVSQSDARFNVNRQSGGPISKRPRSAGVLARAHDYLYAF